MEKEVERLVNIWQNEFALSYEDKPRLSNLLKVCRLDIGKDEIEPGIKMVFIVFYALNTAQCTWIEENLLFEMQERFAHMAGLENLTLGVDVDNSEEGICIIDSTPHNSQLENR
jgi:hypothetical protein